MGILVLNDPMEVYVSLYGDLLDSYSFMSLKPFLNMTYVNREPYRIESVSVLVLWSTRSSEVKQIVLYIDTMKTSK